MHMARMCVCVCVILFAFLQHVISAWFARCCLTEQRTSSKKKSVVKVLPIICHFPVKLFLAAQCWVTGAKPSSWTCAINVEGQTFLVWHWNFWGPRCGEGLGWLLQGTTLGQTQTPPAASTLQPREIETPGAGVDIQNLDCWIHAKTNCLGRGGSHG